MNPKAIALLSGGLDSTLAVCMMKGQGIEIEAVNFQTMFGCCKDDARQVAHRLGVKFTFLKVGDDYLDLVKNPAHGYGRGINPCVDCRGYMFQTAKKYMETVGASFLVSGEVLGQRPMSQKMTDFRLIEEDCRLEGKIVRPLSAKLLPVTEPERSGILDRRKLYGIQGRSRQKLLELAEKFGIEDPPGPSSGCALTSPVFAKKVRDIFDHREDYERWEFEILKRGRHFRLDHETKIIVGRNENENQYLEYLHPKGTTLLVCKNFSGPHALLAGQRSEENLQRAASIMLRYAQKPLPGNCEVQVETEGEVGSFHAAAEAAEEMIAGVRIV